MLQLSRRHQGVGGFQLCEQNQSFIEANMTCIAVQIRLRTGTRRLNPVSLVSSCTGLSVCNSLSLSRATNPEKSLEGEEVSSASILAGLRFCRRKLARQGQGPHALLAAAMPFFTWRTDSLQSTSTSTEGLQHQRVTTTVNCQGTRQ